MATAPSKHHRRSIRLKGYDYSQPGAYFITLVTNDRECLFGEIVNGEMRLSECGRIVQEEWLRTAKIRPNVQLDEFVIMPNHFHAVLIITDATHVGANGSLAPDQRTTTDSQDHGHAASGANHRLAPTPTNLGPTATNGSLAPDQRTTTDSQDHMHAASGANHRLAPTPTNLGPTTPTNGSLAPEPRTTTDSQDHGHATSGANHRLAPTPAPEPRMPPAPPMPGSVGAIMAQFKSVVAKRINGAQGTQGMPVWQHNYYEHVLRSDEEMRRARAYIQENPGKWEADQENPRNVKGR
ncbi:MAG: hypothetical protein WCF84_07695 [Anaerolineae bacterium]